MVGDKQYQISLEDKYCRNCYCVTESCYKHCRNCFCVTESSVANVVGTASVLHVYVLLWLAECVFTKLHMDTDPERHCWLWHWRSSTVVSVNSSVTT